MRKGKDRESVASVASGKADQALRARLVHVELNQSAGLEIVERQVSSPFAENDGGQRFPFDVDWAKIQILLRKSQNLLDFRH